MQIELQLVATHTIILFLETVQFGFTVFHQQPSDLGLQVWSVLILKTCGICIFSDICTLNWLATSAFSTSSVLLQTDKGANCFH